MAGKIRGITIEIGGDTKGLVNSLKSADKTIKSTKDQLKDVEKLLKLDPTNTELLRQKQKLLSDAVEQTADKLEKLKDAQKQMNAEGVDRSSAEYMALQREIISTTEYLNDLEQQAARSNATLAKIGATAGKVASGAQKIASATRGMSTAAGAALGGIAGMAYNAAVMSDDLNTLSKQTGFTTADLQKMQYAADRMDVSMDTITGSAARMTRQLIDNEEKFTELGVSTRDSNGEMRSTTDIFYDTIKALSGLENETLRDTLAMDIFGRSANELAGIIDDGGAAFQAYGEEMEALGLVLSQETLDGLNAVNDEIDQIKAQALATFATSGATALKALSPIISQVVGFLDQLFQKIAGLDEQQMKTILTVLAVVAAISPVAGIIGKVAGAVSALMPILSAVFALIAANPILLIIAAIVAAGAAIAVFSEDLKAILTETDNFLQSVFATDFTNIFGPVLGEALNGFLSLLKEVWDGAKQVLEGIITFCKGVFTADWQTAWEGVSSIFSGVFDGLKGILTETDNFLQSVFATDFTNVFGPVLGEVLNGFLSLLKEVWDGAKQVLEGIITFCKGVFTADWQAAWEGVGSIFSGVFDGLKGIAEFAINGVIGIVNGAIDKINALIELINRIPGVSIGQIGAIGEFSIDGAAASGGTFSRGNILVGENGPEIMTVAGGRATVTPLNGSAPHTPVQPATNGGNLTTNVQVSFTGSLAQLAHILTPEIKAETVRVGPALVN